MTLQPFPGPAPRVVIAGLSGDSGKTLVSLSILLLAQQRAIPTAAFKKGPDYIDAAWLSWASGGAARNLDTFLMGRDVVARSFGRHALHAGLNVIEGNRGLFDGADAQGTHSTAELAKLLKAPLLLVVNTARVTRTIAASVLGCQKFDPALPIAGVILNRVAGRRHEEMLREAVESLCGIPVLGALPKVEDSSLLPSRHLGLVTPQEHRQVEELRSTLLSLAEGHVDFEKITALAAHAPALQQSRGELEIAPRGRGLKIGVLRDSAFTFYYPENLELLERAGACVVPLSALRSSVLPDDLDALYIGGGFPETHADAISANSSLLGWLLENAANGLPIYAECGGLMLLAQAIHWKAQKFAMAGVLPVEVEVCQAPQGHGYVELLVDRANPFFDIGTKIRGHEFHYSKLLPTGDALPAACAVRRGTGSLNGRDGLLRHNVWASYTHVHAAATPEWAEGLLSAARRCSAAKTGAWMSQAS